MPQTRTIRTRQEMDQRYYETLAQLIRSQGYRELAAATVFAEALHLVPGRAFKKKVVQHVNEEMEHFEVPARRRRWRARAARRSALGSARTP